MNSLQNALLRTGRPEMKSTTAATVSRRVLAWTVVQTTATLLLAWAIPHIGPPDYLLVLAMGLGAASTRRRALLYAPLTLTVALLATATALYFGGSGLAAGAAVVGAGVGIADTGREHPWRTVNGALAAASLASVGYVLAHLFSETVPKWLELPFVASFTALLCALTLVVQGMGWKAVARIPSLTRIRDSLKEPYRAACERAWELDRNVGRYTPDRVTREGLGEVAAWVYRLSLTLQTLDHELAQVPTESIRARIEASARAAAETQDAYTAERRQATQRHLEGVLRHREALALERERTESLVEYALATLEESRTGLVSSREMPGHATPEGISEVLDRLRSHATQEVARRNTALELEKVP